MRGRASYGESWTPKRGEPGMGPQGRKEAGRPHTGGEGRRLFCCIGAIPFGSKSLS